MEREKGVVLSELAARDNAGLQADAQRLEALYAGTLLPMLARAALARLPAANP